MNNYHFVIPDLLLCIRLKICYTIRHMMQKMYKIQRYILHYIYNIILFFTYNNINKKYNIIIYIILWWWCCVKIYFQNIKLIKSIINSEQCSEPSLFHYLPSSSKILKGSENQMARMTYRQRGRLQDVAPALMWNWAITLCVSIKNTSFWNSLVKCLIKLIFYWFCRQFR